MKVLHINTYDKFGGAEKIAYTLYTYQPDATLLVKNKLRYFHDPSILEFPSSSLDKFFNFIDKVLWKLNLKKGLKTYFQAADQFHFTYDKLRAMPAYQEADIIHLHNLHGKYFDLSALRSMGREKKVIWTLHDMWAFTGGEAYISPEVLSSSSTYLASKELDSTPLNGPVVDRREYFLKLKKTIYHEIANNLYFVPVSKWLETSFKSSLVYQAGLQVQTIYNGIETAKYDNLGSRTWRVPRVLFFNSDSPFKGADVFTTCLGALNRRFKLIVVGKEIQHEVNAAIKVDYLARVDEEQALAALFNNVDILVFPSVAEAFGLMPAEAMLCGVLVISSDAGGLQELVIKNETGMVFKNGDSRELAKTLEEALDDLERTREIGERSREFVLNNFSLKSMLHAYDKLYQKVMEGDK